MFVILDTWFVFLINKHFNTISGPSSIYLSTFLHPQNCNTPLQYINSFNCIASHPNTGNLSEGFMMIKRLARIKVNTYRLSRPG
jgi:hypothetical protein